MRDSLHSLGRKELIHFTDLDAAYREHAASVYRFLLAKTGSGELAEDLTQETFYRAVQSADRFDGLSKISTTLTRSADSASAKSPLRKRSAPTLPPRLKRGRRGLSKPIRSHKPDRRTSTRKRKPFRVFFSRFRAEQGQKRFGGAHASVDSLCRVRADAVCNRAFAFDSAAALYADASRIARTVCSGGSMPHHTILYPMKKRRCSPLKNAFRLLCGRKGGRA